MLEVQRLDQPLRPHPGARRRRPARGAGRTGGAGRRQRRGQDHAAARALRRAAVHGGSILFDGAGHRRAASPRQRVQMGIVQVPEGRQVFGPMSVRGQPAARRLRAQARRGASSSACSRCSPCCSDKRREAAGNLSGGQQQMLAIGRALMARAAAAAARRAEHGPRAAPGGGDLRQVARAEGAGARRSCSSTRTRARRWPSPTAAMCWRAAASCSPAAAQQLLARPAGPAGLPGPVNAPASHTHGEDETMKTTLQPASPPRRRSRSTASAPSISWARRRACTPRRCSCATSRSPAASCCSRTSIRARTRSARASSSTTSRPRCSACASRSASRVAEVKGRAVTLRGRGQRQRRRDLPRHAPALRRRRQEDRGAAGRQGAEGGTGVNGRARTVQRPDLLLPVRRRPRPAHRQGARTASPPRSSRISAPRDVHPGGGKVCVKAYGLVQKTYNPNRVLHADEAHQSEEGPRRGPGLRADLLGRGVRPHRREAQPQCAPRA